MSWCWAVCLVVSTHSDGSHRFAYNQNIFLHFKECIIESDYLELSPEKFCATRTGLVGNAVGEEDANACIRT